MSTSSSRAGLLKRVLAVAPVALAAARAHYAPGVARQPTGPCGPSCKWVPWDDTTFMCRAHGLLHVCGPMCMSRVVYVGEDRCHMRGRRLETTHEAEFPRRPSDAQVRRDTDAAWARASKVDRSLPAGFKRTAAEREAERRAEPERRRYASSVRKPGEAPGARQSQHANVHSREQAERTRAVFGTALAERMRVLCRLDIRDVAQADAIYMMDVLVAIWRYIAQWTKRTQITPTAFCAVILNSLSEREGRLPLKVIAGELVHPLPVLSSEGAHCYNARSVQGAQRMSTRASRHIQRVLYEASQSDYQELRATTEAAYARWVAMSATPTSC